MTQHQIQNEKSKKTNNNKHGIIPVVADETIYACVLSVDSSKTLAISFLMNWIHHFSRANVIQTLVLKT